MFWNSLTRIVAPTSLPVTLADIKSHLAISHSDEDAYLTSLINVATAYVDGPNGAGIALRPQTWRASYDSVPRRHTIPFGPVRSIISIITGTATVSPTTYNLDTDTGILFLDNAIYPSDVRTKITFTVGYDTIPDDLLHVIRLLVGHLYANREATALVAMHDVPLAVESILNRYRVHVV